MSKDSRCCGYDEPWRGECGRPADESGLCPSHKEKKCVVCGQQAAYGCPVSGSLTCGAPLCGSDDCNEQHSKIHYG